MRRSLFTSMLAAAALTGCKTEDQNQDPPIAQEASLSRFESCGELRGYVEDAYVEMFVQSYLGWGYYGYPVSEDADSGGDDGGGSEGPSDFSETNVQEEGVDEPDIVKTDGNFVYVLQSTGELSVVKSWPVEEAAAVGSVEFEGYPYSMFLQGDQIAVFSYVYDESAYYSDDGTADDMGFKDGYATRVSLIDVSDRTAPRVTREIDIEGWLADSRMIDGRIYSVFNTWTSTPSALWELQGRDDLNLPSNEGYYDLSELEKEILRAEVRSTIRPHIAEIVDAMDTADLLPRAFDHAPDEVVDGEPLMACSDVYRPEGVSQPNILSVVSLDLNDPDAGVEATGLIANGWTVYASLDNLYVAQSSWYWYWGWGDLDLSTHIHRFKLGEDAVYEASGEVDGWLYDQFAMSEYDGNLRVTTTDNDWWWGSGEAGNEGNSVFVMDADDMSPVGEVRGIAPDEMIYATRFLGDVAYMVTFRQTDPLFAIDLSDPTAPVVRGELQMPGYSGYLHPYGEDRLIGVGMEGTEDGQILGMAVNLFDVSDMANPTLVEQYTIASDDWSWSEALWDHHAFTLHRDVLSLPIYTWDCDDTYEICDGFSGMLSIGVSRDGLTEVGRVDHSDLIADSECLYGNYGYYDDSEGGSGGEDDSVCADYYWYAQMRRSVVIEDNLFSISDYGVKITDLNDPTDEIARVLFHPR